MENLNLKEIILPLTIFLFAVILGLGFKRFLFVRLKKWSEKTQTRIDDILFSSLNAPLVLLVFVFAVWTAQLFYEIPHSYTRVIDTVARLAIILAALFFADRFLSSLIFVYADRYKVLSSSKRLLKTAIHLIIFTFVLLFVLSALGISITPLVASLGIGSMAIALALQDTLGQAFSGVYLIIDQPIAKGDFIKLEDGREGFVENVGWRSTRLKLWSNDIVIIPNSKLASSVITNYEQPDAQSSVLIQCGVHYDSDLEKVEKVVKDVAKQTMQKHPAGLKNYEPRFGFYEFADSSINFYCRLGAIRYKDHYGLKSQFIKALHKRFNEEGIVIPFPIRTVYLQKEA